MRWINRRNCLLRCNAFTAMSTYVWLGWQKTDIDYHESFYFCLSVDWQRIGTVENAGQLRMTFNGYEWLLMKVDSGDWLQSATYNCRWKCQARDCFGWLQMAINGCRWYLTTAHGYGKRQIIVEECALRMAVDGCVMRNGLVWLYWWLCNVYASWLRVIMDYSSKLWKVDSCGSATWRKFSI